MIPMRLFLILILISISCSDAVAPDDLISTVRNQPCFQTDRGGCWDLGSEDGVQTATACQHACLLRPQCEAFLYSPTDLKCNFCSATDASWANRDGCPQGENCIYGPVKCPHSTSSLSVTGILESSVLKAKNMCDVSVSRGTANIFQHALNTALLAPASSLHQIIKSRDEYDEEPFSEAYEQAVEDAIKILPLLTCSRPCSGILRLQLQSMVFFNTFSSTLVFPDDVAREKLLHDFKVMLADNNFLTEDSVHAIYRVYEMLPDHLRPNDLDDVTFAVQYFPNAYNCESYDENLVDFTNFTYTTSPSIQWNVTSTQSFPIDTPMMPIPGDTLLTAVQHEFSARFYEVVASNPRLASMLNFLYMTSVEGNHARHWLGKEGPEFFEKNPREILAIQIGRQYMFSSSSQLSLAVSRWGSFNIESSVSVLQGHKCDDIDMNLGDNITSRLACRREARNNKLCTGDFYMWDGVGQCSCCSADAQFIKDESWSVHKYRTNDAPQVPTSLPLSWWLLNVDILTDIDTATSTFYEYNDDGEVVPICVNVWRDDNGRIETIEVPGCGLLDFTYASDDEFLVDAVTDNALACRPVLSHTVCKSSSLEDDRTDNSKTRKPGQSASGYAPVLNAKLVILSALLLGISSLQ